MSDHISYTQLSTYMSCPLKYKFQYIDQLEWPFVPAALTFGSCIHSALGYYYLQHSNGKDVGTKELCEVFQEEWLTKTQDNNHRFGRGEDSESMLKLGKSMLSVFLKSAEPQQVLEVERSFSQELIDPETGEILSLPLVGVIDLIEADAEGNVVIVDHKTGSYRMSDVRVDTDQQMSAYSYFAAQNELANGKDVLLRFDLLLKKDNPELIQYYTVRGEKEHQQFIKTVKNIMEAIDHQVFFPNPSFMCSGCVFSEPCKTW